MSDFGKLLLRLAVGGLMLFHGVNKVQHPESLDFLKKLMEGKGLPEFLAYGVYVGEVVAPLLVVIGFLVRPAGVIIAATMAVAVWLVHTGDLARIDERGGAYALEIQAFYFLGGLAIACLGSGKLGVSKSD